MAQTSGTTSARPDGAAKDAKDAKDAKEQPIDRLKGEFQNLLGAARDWALASARDKVGDTTKRLAEYAEKGGNPGLTAALTGTQQVAEGKSPTLALLGGGFAGVKSKIGNLFGRGKGGQGKKLKVTNIVETIDVGVPVRIAYNQWTQFRDFPSFMKKVEGVEQQSEEKLNWKAQIFWSHRSWESTILRQIPDERIVWRSKGAKGSVDGTVTFHELTPTLTRILLVLEYHPQGFFEQTGNMWRAQGRRARLEFKHFRRHVMTQTILNPDDIEGWRGVIEDGQVVKDHKTALQEEQQAKSAEEGQEGEAGPGEERLEDEGGEATGEEGRHEDDETEGQGEDEETEDQAEYDETEDEDEAEDEAADEDEDQGVDQDEGDEETPGRRNRSGSTARAGRSRRDAGQQRPSRGRPAPARARRGA